PPVKVAGSYESVVTAEHKKKANILSAQADQVRTNAQAEAEAMKLKRAAEGERARVVASAEAYASLFTNQVRAFNASPTVYARRAYLQSLLRGGAGTRKIVMAATNISQTYQLNLEEKFRPDVLDIPLPATPKSK
ncbi:MAG TPA: hypothetical protein VGE41_01155, partial [Verrucomicrobiae bacterium]